MAETPESRYTLAFAHVNSRQSTDAVRDLDGGEFSSPLEAFGAALARIADHAYANRFRILQFHRSSFPGGSGWDGIGQYDVDRDMLWPVEWDLRAGAPDPFEFTGL